MDSRLEPLVDTLVQARRKGIQARPAKLDPPMSVEDAYAVQHAANAKFEGDFVGWKNGATNQGARDGLGLEESFIGPIPKSAVLGDGATVPFTETTGAIEPEIAFLLSADLDGGQDAASVRAAVKSAHLAIEVIGRRIVGEGFDAGVGLIADFAGNAAFVVGPAVDLDALSSAGVEVFRDDASIETGSTANVMGDPYASLAWAANLLAERGTPLKAGQWVSTGTCTPAVKASKGATVRCVFEGLGEVSVSFG